MKEEKVFMHPVASTMMGCSKESAKEASNKIEFVADKVELLYKNQKHADTMQKLAHAK